MNIPTILAALAIPLAACATEPKPQPAFDTFVKGVLDAVPEAPSFGIAVVKDGRTIYLHNADTPYYIGSTTKAYTGLACAILATRGRIDLDVPVSKYLPEVTLANAPTLRSFLTHTSGIENTGIVMRTAYTGEYINGQLASLLNDSRTIKPGFSYDNLGYVVASLVIERVMAKPWQDALAELVFKPLGMHHTTARMSEAQKWGMPVPYTVNRGGRLEPVTLLKTDKTMHAAGGIVTTPRDLARWLDANIRKEGGGIPRAAFDEAQKLQTPVTPDRMGFTTRGYGFGWFVGGYHGEEALEHGGGYPGWSSLFSFMPERQIGVGVMTNSSSAIGQRMLMTITSFVDDVLLGKTVDVDARLTAVRAEVAKGRTAMAAELEKRAQRPWMLKHANEAYTGRYENPSIGTLTIASEGGHLVASLANLHAVLEAFTEAESARVEMVPGSGEVLRFKFSEGADRPQAVAWESDTFARVP